MLCCHLLCIMMLGKKESLSQWKPWTLLAGGGLLGLAVGVFGVKVTAFVDKEWLKARCKFLSQRNQELRSQVHAEQHKNNDLKRMDRQLREVLDAVRKECSALKSRVAKLESDLTDETEAKQKVKLQLSESQTQCKKLIDELERQDVELSKLHQNVKKLCKLNKHADKKLVEYQERLKAMEGKASYTHEARS